MLALCKQFLWGGSYTTCYRRREQGRAAQACRAELSHGSTDVQQSSSAKETWSRPTWKRACPGGSEAIENGQVGLDLVRKEAERTGDLFLDRDTVPYGQVGKLWPSHLFAYTSVVAFENGSYQ